MKRYRRNPEDLVSIDWLKNWAKERGMDYVDTAYLSTHGPRIVYGIKYLDEFSSSIRRQIRTAWKKLSWDDGDDNIDAGYIAIPIATRQNEEATNNSHEFRKDWKLDQQWFKQAIKLLDGYEPEDSFSKRVQTLDYREVGPPTAVYPSNEDIITDIPGADDAVFRFIKGRHMEEPEIEDPVEGRFKKLEYNPRKKRR